jgi:H+/Cl- antiporter ClcA
VNLARLAARRLLEHPYGFTLATFVAAAAATGVGCVWFMWGFEWVLERRLDFARLGAWAWLSTPLLFVLSVQLIRRAAPFAAGTGIPQAAFAARRLTPANEEKLAPLTSAATLLVKVAALFMALLAGASTGREGPTVHVAACLFVGVVGLARRFAGVTMDLRSAVVAGGAAGLAAAFNTPLAGVTFAVEELSSDYFGSIKDFVLISIIIAAVTAKSFTGEYGYFGRLLEPPDVPWAAVAAIGALGGLLGALFSTAILEGQRALAPRHRDHPYALPALLALGLLALASVSPADVLGPGNGPAKALVRGEFGDWAWSFPAAKMAATLLTYWAGVAGGVFAPCLSIGAALGADVAALLRVPVTSCALVGMAAFLSGTIQAPITAFVIIFEMTGHHRMLPPVMLGALAGSVVARLAGARHLYGSLAEGYQRLLDGEPGR